MKGTDKRKNGKSGDALPCGNDGAFGKRKYLTLIACGAAAGAVNGFFGGGGGMIIVPLLTSILKLDALRAHATAILIVLPLSVFGAVAYTAGGNADMQVLIPVILGFSLGGFFGARLLNGISGGAATAVFALLMLASGIFLAVR